MGRSAPCLPAPPLCTSWRACCGSGSIRRGPWRTDRLPEKNRLRAIDRWVVRAYTATTSILALWALSSGAETVGVSMKRTAVTGTLLAVGLLHHALVNKGD